MTDTWRNDLNERRQAIISLPAAQILEDVELRAELGFIYFQLFNDSICSVCDSKIQGYINKLKKVNFDTMEENPTKRKYQLKQGLIIQTIDKTFTNQNTTDAEFEAYLKKYPHQEKHFVINRDIEVEKKQRKPREKVAKKETHDS